MKKRVACCFTGGKDSCLVVHLLSAVADAPSRSAQLPQLGDSELVLLVVFSPEGGAGAFKAHPIDLIRLQATALGLPLEIVEIKSQPSYLEGYRTAITTLKEVHKIDVLATGDILDVCSDFMGKATEGIVQLWRPLWGLPRTQLLDLLWAYSIEPIISCINLPKFGLASGESKDLSGHCQVAQGADASCHGSGSTLEAAATAGSAAAPAAGTALQGVDAMRDILGHVISPSFHATVLKGVCAELGIDECGEGGEFHTMVVSAPLFKGQRLKLGLEKQKDGEFAFLKVLDMQLVAN